MFGLNHFCVVSKTNLRSLFLFPELEFAIKKLVSSANSTGTAYVSLVEVNHLYKKGTVMVQQQTPEAPHV